MSLIDIARARELLHESLQIDREFENEWGIALNVGNLGALALDDRDRRPLRAHRRGPRPGV